MNGMNVGSALSVAPGHVVALFAPLLLPLIIRAFLLTVDWLDRRGIPLATRFVEGYNGSSSLARVVAVLMLLAGVIHLVLVPAHLDEAPTLAILFALNGMGFAALAATSFIWRGWRLAAVLLVLATLGAYLFYLISGREALDEVGFACYLVELVILALVWIPDYNGATRSTRAERPDGKEQAFG